MKLASKAMITVLCCGLFMLAARPAVTGPAPQDLKPAEVEFFETKIRPVLAAQCYLCHSAQSKKPQGGLLLDTREGLLTGGASGLPAVVPGDPEKGTLIKAIRFADAKVQMPPTGKLSDDQIKDFEAWVKMGAPDPRTAAPAAAANSQPYDFNQAKKFWSFQPVKDHAPPAVKQIAWARTPVDRFILARLEAKHLTPAPDADRRTLIRRATFDLTGLPPTPEEVDAFLKDTSPDAFAKVVDRLLASPAYGEKWGRHWLDVVRYADTAGDNSDFPITAAYRYRNYVIESFNRDKPYDQFVHEQLAGDLLPAKTEAEKRERIVATGYVALSRRFGSRNAEFNLTIDDTIDNVGKAFLGLSVSCARCHDHKFDPIPQRDYYALYGIFNSSRYSFPGAEIYPNPAEMVALESGPKAESFYRYQKELSDLDDQKERLQTERGIAARNKRLKEQQAKETAQKEKKEDKEPAAAAKENNNRTDDDDESGEAKKTAPAAASLKSADYNRDSENHKVVQTSTRLPEEVDADMLRVKARMAELRERRIKVDKAYAVVDGLPANARLHRKGDPASLGDEVPRGFLTVLGGEKVPAGHKGSGRDVLAGWIASAQNPLTARVFVNRIWQYHFGKGLAPTPNDFGVRGQAPTHPELLDYLAARFVEGGWSVKKMHRLIMLSRVYQLAGAAGGAAAKNGAADANNDLLWRFNRRRLEAEEIRDAILAVSGRLDRSPGGEHPFPSESSWRFTQHDQFFAVYETDRRSVYVMQQRLKRHPYFEVFDGADQNAITGGRAASTTPIQALFLMNNPFMHEQADQLAVRVGMAYETTPARLDYAFRLAVGRPARPEEQHEAAQYLEQARRELQAAGTPAERLTRAALGSYLRVLLSSNEFLYVE